MSLSWPFPIAACCAMVGCGGLVAAQLDGGDELPDAAATAPADAPADASLDATDLDASAVQIWGDVDAPADSSLEVATAVDASMDTAPLDAEPSPCLPGMHLETDACLPDDASADFPSTAPCLAGGNILWAGGDPDNGIFQGTQTFTISQGQVIGAWGFGNSDVRVAIGYPWGWWLQFSITEGAFLQAGVVYSPATFTWATNKVGPPNLDVQFLNDAGQGECVNGEGAFRFDALDVSGNPEGGPYVVDSMTVTFWMHCDGYPGVFRACVQYAQ